MRWKISLQIHNIKGKANVNDLHPMDNNETDPKKGSCTIMGRNYRFNGQPNTAVTVVIMRHAPAPHSPVKPV